MTKKELEKRLAIFRKKVDSLHKKEEATEQKYAEKLKAALDLIYQEIKPIEEEMKKITTLISKLDALEKKKENLLKSIDLEDEEAISDEEVPEAVAVEDSEEMEEEILDDTNYTNPFGF